MPISATDILKDYSQKFVDALHKSLSSVDRISAGGLYQSIKAPVKVFGQTVVMEIVMADYWDYVNSGVSGRVVKYNTKYAFKKNNINQSAIQKFITNRGIKLSDLKNKGKQRSLSIEKKRKSLAFIIGRSIANKGLKPTHFADNVMGGALKSNLEKELLKSVGRQIRIEIKEFKNGNNSSSVA